MRLSSSVRVLLALACLVAIAVPGAARALPTLRIEVISDRADLISGGDALVAVDLPSGADPSAVRVTAGTSDVTSQLAMRDNGRFEGLLTGLALGPNIVTATLPGATDGTVTIVDHPNGGPVFSGPQIQPWTCASKTAKDKQCNEPATFAYIYKSSADGGMHAYDPSKPPSDLAMTKTDNGQTVPFIVRTETGYMDRDQYEIGVLYQPGKAWTAWDPQQQFNHKLLITHGASCGIDRTSSTAPSVTGDTVGVPGGPSAGNSPETALGLGFAVMSTALDNAGHNCNIATEAESLVMAKEHLIEQYGTLRYTIGTGCSGGSLVQQQVANAYPGIYQGILPQCSFQDAWSNAQEISDYHLTRGYFENPQKWGLGVLWTPLQIGAVEGHPNHGNAIIFDNTYWTSLAVPDDGCTGVTTAQTYNAKTNPAGVRCTLADYMINVMGPRPESQWGPVEQKLGHGFAGLPVDNIGVEYGLEPLLKGDITPAQFVDLNQKIGGEDIDITPTAARFTASTPALRNSYASGAVNETNNLKDVAIIDLRGPDPGAFHDAYRSWSMRARLERQEGHFPKNHVMWFGEAPLIGDPNYTTQGLLAMDRWLSAVERDQRGVSLEQKVADDRPSDVHDQCSDIPNLEMVSVPGLGPLCELPLVQTKFSTPRVAAGESIATDQQKCQLKPLRQSDFYPIAFTAAQWTTLQSVYPTGVCDFSKPGVDQVNTVPWQTYQDDANGGGVIYGGEPLGPVPDDSGTGWTSPSFSTWRD